MRLLYYSLLLILGLLTLPDTLIAQRATFISEYPILF